jgi:hypothetical protein
VLLLLLVLLLKLRATHDVRGVDCACRHVADTWRAARIWEPSTPVLVCVIACRYGRQHRARWMARHWLREKAGLNLQHAHDHR